MRSELERIGDDDGIFFHVLENPGFDLSHLFRKKIDIDIIIDVNVCQKKIFFEQFQIGISENLV